MMKLRKGNSIVLGLSDENIRRLKEGNPIKFNLVELGMSDVDVFIYNGRDEQSMYKDFKDQIDPFKTIIKDSNSDKN